MRDLNERPAHLKYRDADNVGNGGQFACGIDESAENNWEACRHHDGTDNVPGLLVAVSVDEDAADRRCNGVDDLTLMGGYSFVRVNDRLLDRRELILTKK